MFRRCWAVWTLSWANATDEGNDEARMTKDERARFMDNHLSVGEAVCFPNSQCREANSFPYTKRASVLSLFGLRHSFGIRHSSFVIALALALMLLTACGGARLTKANVDQVAE